MRYKAISTTTENQRGFYTCVTNINGSLKMLGGPTGSLWAPSQVNLSLSTIVYLLWSFHPLKYLLTNDIASFLEPLFAERPKSVLGWRWALIFFGSSS